MLEHDKLSFINASLKYKNQIISMYKKANWIEKDEENFLWLDNFIKKSFIFELIKLEEKIIGMGRVITDGVSDAYIQDLFVCKEYRGQGIGKKLVNHLVEKTKTYDITWIALIAEPGSRQFYESIGFKEMENHTPMKLG